MNSLLNYSDLIWQSDYNGYELGYDNIPVIGFYLFKVNPMIHLHIDTEHNVILEIWSESDV